MKCDRCNKDVRKLFMAENGEYVCARCIKGNGIPDDVEESMDPED